jgi:CRP/FNR family cyclic AMP-dependent transcriptional regulator
MSVLSDRFEKFTDLGDATPFVARMLEIIEHIQVFEDFDEAEIVALARYMHCYRAPAGVEVIVEDEPGDFMVLLIEGTMEIVKKDFRGLPARIAEANPGKTLGEMSVIDGEPRFASCLSLTDVVFAVLDRDHLSRVIADEPRLGVKLLMQLLMLLNQRLRNVSMQLMKCLEDKRLRRT